MYALNRRLMRVDNTQSSTSHNYLHHSQASVPHAHAIAHSAIRAQQPHLEVSVHDAHVVAVRDDAHQRPHCRRRILQGACSITWGRGSVAAPVLDWRPWVSLPQCVLGHALSQAQGQPLPRSWAVRAGVVPALVGGPQHAASYQSPTATLRLGFVSAQRLHGCLRLSCCTCGTWSPEPYLLAVLAP